MSPILCNVPPELAHKLATGALKRYGSILRNPVTGHIAGFLQEAAPLAKPLASTLQLGLGAAGQLTGLVQIVQNEAIRAGVGRIEQGVGLLQHLAVANMALSATGIGVAVVGFGIVTARLDQVRTALGALGEHVDALGAKIDGVRQDMLEADFTAVHSLCSLHEEAWAFADRDRAERQWLRVVHDARSLQDRFALRARDLMASGPGGDPAVADAMIDALALTSSVRVSSLVACNETALARSISREAATQIEAMTGSIGLYELATRHLPTGVEPGTQAYGSALDQAREAALPAYSAIREREAAAATWTAPLAFLEQRGIAPREWLEAARAETKAPVLMLMADEEVAFA